MVKGQYIKQQSKYILLQKDPKESLGLLAVELDVDAKAIVNLSSNNDSSSADFASILVNCRQFLNQIPALKVSHRLAYILYSTILVSRNSVYLDLFGHDINKIYAIILIS